MLPVGFALTDRLAHAFQAGFSLQRGAGLSDPHHTAMLGTGRPFIEHKFNHLTALQLKTSAQPVTVLREIEHEAGKSFQLETQLEDQTCAFPGSLALRPSALGER